MRCPFCHATDSRVIDSRLVDEENQIRRRRECPACNERFTTYETVELVMPQIIKRDLRRVNFDVNKLRTGLMKALEKRPVSAEQIDSTITHITRALRALGDKEVPSSVLGDMLMVELRQLDQVAYVRFASVHRSFQDVHAFKDEINRLEENS